MDPPSASKFAYIIRLRTHVWNANAAKNIRTINNLNIFLAVLAFHTRAA